MKPVAIRVANLAKVVSIATRLVRRTSNTPSSSIRIHYARELFAKAQRHGRSIQALVAQARRTGTVDIGGICGLSRLVIEAHNAFVYLGEANISEAERKLRFRVMYINDSVDLIRISRALGISSSDSRIHLQERSMSWSKAELANNPVFMALPKEQRDKLLEGRYPYIQNRYRGKRPIAAAVESAAYNLFSHNVHSFGLSARLGGAWTPAGAMNSLFLAIEVALIYLSHMTVLYRQMRPRSAGALTRAERDLLDDALSAAHLRDWMNELKQPKGL